MLIATSFTSMAAANSNWTSLYSQGENALSEQQPAEAETYFRKALAAAQQNAPSSEDVIKCQTKLADTLVLRNKTAEAQDLYRKALASTTKRFGNTKKIVPLLMALGSIQESTGDHTTAISYYQRALKINENNFGPYSPAFAENLHVLGKANLHAGRKSEAVKDYKKALSIMMKDPSLVAGGRMQNLMHDYSDLLTSDDDSNKTLLDDFDKEILGKTKSSSASQSTTIGTKSENLSAWQLQGTATASRAHQTQLNAAPDISTRALNRPFSDKSLAPNYRIMNQSIVDQGRSDMGEDYYQRMISVDLKALGENHPSVANDLNGLAHLYIRQKNYAKAEPSIKRAYNTYQRIYGSDNVLTISAAASYALVEARLGRTQEAIALYSTALSFAQSNLGPNNFETAKILNELSFLYYQQGNLDEAKTLYRWALASTEASVGKESPLYAACLQDYAKLLNTMGDTKEASDYEDRAKLILSNSASVTR